MGSYFCSNACPCKATRTSFPPTGDYIAAVFSLTGASTVNKCPTNPVSSVQQTVLSFLGFMEEELSCSGICKKEKWYYYSDVNRGAPADKCQDKLNEKIDSIHSLHFL